MATNETLNKQYISIRPGETKVLPKGAKIISAINYGDVTVVSECFNIETESAQCYKMRWSRAVYSGTNGETTPLYGIRLEYIEILGVKYNLQIEPSKEELSGVITTGFVDGTGIVLNRIRSVVPKPLMNVHSLKYKEVNRRVEYILEFQSVETVASTITMNIKDVDSRGDGSFEEDGLYIKPILNPEGCTGSPVIIQD